MAFNWTGAATGAGVGFAAGGPVGAGAGALAGGYGGDILNKPLGGITGSIPGLGSDPLGSFFGGGQKIGAPKKDDFNYGGMNEGGFQNQGNSLYNANRLSGLQDLSRFRQSRGDMQALQAKLGQMATDPNQSAALQANRMANDQNLANALALAGSSRGGAGGQAAALRGAQMQNATASQQALAQGQIARMQEQQALLGQQGQLMTAGAGLDTQTAMQQFGLGQQGMLGMYGLGQNAAMAQQRGQEDYWKTLLGAQAAQAQADAQQKAGLMGMVGGIGGGLIAGGVISDISGKTDIVPMSGPAFQNPGMPAITTGGAMQPASMQAPFDYGQQRRNELAGDIFKQAMQQRPGQVVFQGADQYLPTFGDQIVSDARAKKLEGENDFLRDRLKETGYALGVAGGAASSWVPLVVGSSQAMLPPSHLKHMPVPQQVMPQPRNELEAAQYGQRWIERNRADAMRDAAAHAAYQQQVAQAQDALKYSQALTPVTDAAQDYRAQTGAPPEITSDARAKQDAFQLGMHHGRSNAGIMPPVGTASYPIESQAANVPAYQFRYREPFAQAYGSEPRVGAMAQDLERNPLYAPAVKTQPNGLKVVDSGQATMANIAALSDVSRHAQELEDRLRKLESVGSMMKPTVKQPK